MTTIQEAAHQMSRAFEGATRPDGTEYRRLKEDAPQWMTDVAREAHHGYPDLLPDDWRYIFIERACDALADYEDADEARGSLEPDVYTSELTGWLHSHNGRAAFCDEAYAEYGASLERNTAMFQLLQLGQLAEMQETFDLVRDALSGVAVALS